MSALAVRSLFAAALAAIAGGAQASIVLFERNSYMEVYYNFGGGIETFPGSNGTGSNLLTADSIELVGSDSGSGFTEFGTWEAGMSYDLRQEFAPTAFGFDGSGSTSLFAFAGGDGYSYVESIAPGNEQAVWFVNTSLTDFTLNGALTDGASVRLQRLTQSGWDDVYTAANSMGSFGTNGQLAIGEYRILAVGSVTANANQQMGAAYSYSFAAVPEPGTMIALGLGAAAMMARRRRK